MKKIINQLAQQVEESQTQAQQLLHAVIKEAFTRKAKEYGINDDVILVAEK